MRTSIQAGVRACVALAIVFGIGLLFWRAPILGPETHVPGAPSPGQPPARRLPAPQPPRVASPRLDDPIDGEPVPPELRGRRPVAVVVDNHPQARPQWGLSRASRVYEALTEGGITRYLAVFSRADADRVGPVRSIRTQFLDYALELDAALAHVGGNEDALALIPRLHVKDLNEFRYASPYRRIPARGVAFEHTMFASTAALRGVVEQMGWGEDPPAGSPPWKADAPPDGRPAGQQVTIDFSEPQYRVSWIYRRGPNLYERRLAGAPDRDAATGNAIVAKSIAIVVVPRVHGRTPIGEDTWTFFDVGAGAAWVVQDGTVTPGTWRKASRAARLRFFDRAGTEIALDRGPQWVEVIPPEVVPVFRQRGSAPPVDSGRRSYYNGSDMEVGLLRTG